MNGIQSKEYFVIITESEIETLHSEPQIAVYRSIKSFSANGKKEVGLSVRDITERTKMSKSTVQRVIQELIAVKIISHTGNYPRIGGAVPIYRINSPSVPSGVRFENTSVPFENESVPFASQSVPNGEESVPSSGTKIEQYNKSKKNKEVKATLDDFSSKELSELADKYKITVEDIDGVIEKMKLWLESSGKKYADYALALERWIIGDIERKILKPRLSRIEQTIQYLMETENLSLEDAREASGYNRNKERVSTKDIFAINFDMVARACNVTIAEAEESWIDYTRDASDKQITESHPDQGLKNWIFYQVNHNGKYKRHFLPGNVTHTSYIYRNAGPGQYPLLATLNGKVCTLENNEVCILPEGSYYLREDLIIFLKRQCTSIILPSSEGNLNSRTSSWLTESTASTTEGNPIVILDKKFMKPGSKLT